MALLIATSLSVACGHHGRAASPVAQTPALRHTHENLNAVLWMRTAVEYRASAEQAYRLARMQLDAALADPTWTAAVEQTGDATSLPPAVVLDLDETVFDNSEFQARLVATGTPYSEDSWNDWCREERAHAVPGAASFLTYAARQRHVTPIYITNRSHEVEDATRATLNRLGIPVDPSDDGVLTIGEHGWRSDKGERRRYVAGRYRILLLVGDDFGDFVSGATASSKERAALETRYADRWGLRWIVLPNPAYGSWERAIWNFDATLTDQQQLAAKFQAIAGTVAFF